MLSASLVLVDKVEEVAEEDSVLLTISCTQVKEFLRSAPKIWHPVKVLVVFNHRNQTNVSCCLLNREVVGLAGYVLVVVDVCRRRLRMNVAAEEHGLATHVLAEDFHVALLELAFAEASDPLGCRREEVLLLEADVVL